MGDAAHVYTEDQPEIHDVTTAIRDWIDQFSFRTNRDMYVNGITISIP